MEKRKKSVWHSRCEHASSLSANFKLNFVSRNAVWLMSWEIMGSDWMARIGIEMQRRSCLVYGCGFNVFIIQTTHLPFTDLKQYYTNDEITEKNLFIFTYTTLTHHRRSSIHKKLSKWFMCIWNRGRERETVMPVQHQSIIQYIELNATRFTIPTPLNMRYVGVLYGIPKNANTHIIHCERLI